jgi:hypothetical protein
VDRAIEGGPQSGGDLEGAEVPRRLAAQHLGSDAQVDARRQGPAGVLARHDQAHHRRPASASALAAIVVRKSGRAARRRSASSTQRPTK